MGGGKVGGGEVEGVKVGGETAHCTTISQRKLQSVDQFIVTRMTNINYIADQ